MINIYPGSTCSLLHAYQQNPTVNSIFSHRFFNSKPSFVTCTFQQFRCSYYVTLKNALMIHERAERKSQSCRYINFSFDFLGFDDIDFENEERMCE